MYVSHQLTYLDTYAYLIIEEVFRSPLMLLPGFKGTTIATQFSSWGPFLLSRTLSSSASVSASSIASSFSSRFKDCTPQTRTQILDANQLRLLSLTLNRPSLYPGSNLSNTAHPPPAGTPLPPGYHLVYFTPAACENELGVDGTDRSYSPDPPFTRRMWAGGEMHWPRSCADGRINPLRVGQEVRETTRFLAAEAKVVKRTGEEMIIVGVEKLFENEDGIAVIDRR